jgi:hypothetical protein
MSRNLFAGVGAVALLAISGCTSTTTLSSYLPEDTKIIVRFLANDLPLPDSSSINRSGTVITGSGNNWAGRIELTAPQTPGQLMRFFAEGAVRAGWALKSTTVSSTIILVMEKEGRVGAIEIADTRSRNEGGGLLGLGGGSSSTETEVRISVNHKDAVQDQTPFEGGALLSSPNRSVSADLTATNTSPQSPRSF